MDGKPLYGIYDDDRRRIRISVHCMVSELGNAVKDKVNDRMSFKLREWGQQVRIDQESYFLYIGITQQTQAVSVWCILNTAWREAFLMLFQDIFYCCVALYSSCKSNGEH